MINIAISLGVWLVLAVLPKVFLDMSLWLTVPFGLIAGLVVFILLGRKVQERLQAIMAQMQRDLSENKIDRAIATLHTGFAFEKRHILVGAQLHSQIGSLYYLKKDQDKALEHFKKGTPQHYMAQGMMAAVFFKRKDYDAMRKTMDQSLKITSKEAFVYGLYAWFLMQIQDKDGAVAVLQKGLAKLPSDVRLQTNLTQLQNNKKLKMKLFGDMWLQMMLERPPRIMQQQAPPHMRVSRKAMFR